MRIKNNEINLYMFTWRDLEYMQNYTYFIELHVCVYKHGKGL